MAKPQSHLQESDLPVAEWLPNEQFSAAMAALPLVSLDLCVVDGAQRLLLGKRVNEPAKGWWFTPGGCIRKHEPWRRALARIASQEIGCDAALVGEAKLLGIYDHFYASSAYSDRLTTHYVNLPHGLNLEPEQLRLPADDQHTEWRWQPLAQAAEDPAVHPYVRGYAALLLEDSLLKPRPAE